MNIVILAAGQGKRMCSKLPKVLQPVGNMPMLSRVIQTAKTLGTDHNILVVVGHGGQVVVEACKDDDLKFVEQKEQKGTGHAVMQTLPHLRENEPTLVLYGDVPLIQSQTLKKLLEKAGDGFGLLSLKTENPTGYGRVIRQNGKVVGIVEQKDASEEQKLIKEVNTGFMVLPTPYLNSWLSQIDCNNSQGEYYLTDLVGLAVRDGMEIQTVIAEDEMEVAGANNKVQLSELERALQERLALELMNKGVRLADPKRIDIRGNLHCENDVFIDVGCVFEGNVSLGEGVSVGPYCVLKNVSIASGTKIDAYSHFDDATIGQNVKIGPFARIRPGTILSNNVHVGNFVEIKKSSIGTGSKINHLSYIGDCDMGSSVNIGAGTITCNYDGVNKYRTTIEDDCFIGSDSQFVAPVTVKKGATVGAGSTITKTVPENTLALSRGRQIVIEGWKRPTKK
ncbi:MAG: bifunctional UDP-N-acetylglucosamine diphosphorylase/glucosamine-1-phosphate N-acetyltransferase GlmU [Burkholderiaceae bacterium]|nr:bifunctional UDP-N-acetylglucosamine diphosphorylase/glucosamine-1-phosphate N-acetyltransferase GlmU [Burkholderiaceae bacterium]